MAKGLRSSAKLAHRNAKRRDEKSDYRVIEAARMNAITSRLQAGLAKPKMEVYSVADIEAAAAKKAAGADETAAATADGEMQIDETAQAPKKISTSGPRENARSRWKKARAPKGGKSKKGGKR
ncbi:uncharacterized protein PFL1_01897 [Pseudozyma flocculosa PF-1]|uniref:uncharacterized protein n=1 Tax=Pseudozyma flocculosa PF-1 TaxID=1277687 RepID=UPI000456138A|nr:uncharacterized protein PFL1_01897 [Pseudozyma flocculosa PF-1]EPQ30371.1 hypothetical protein PFL1_01897 [Pseudozyma flocculosa PF-1]